ncbi:rab effector MyRIP isoform X1 [Clarias gariepinus]|uniref:rab effector MyRIP isoform X1 n=1 Tax=Clarias gariepinus TaxID=13013 RepID=UPI00234C1CA3|nr:rab effector MyRIP isoform X1 [Clarias gariepinus]XP_053343970.1 rab effector MyRIP isoform X1 [Clarias gariepinus]
MGRKLDLSQLTDGEAEHVLKVVQRDMKLRKTEEDRLSDLKHELEEEGARCLLLAKQRDFNEQCCIRCCGPFSFFLKPRRICLDCRYNVCKACCSYIQHENGYVCAICHKSRLLRARSLEWYYNNVKSRFKRFGSAKVLKTLYRKHIIERGVLSELPEVSAHEASNDNDGSLCGSDSAFSKQSESHSIGETLTVALRVAEEAIEEAITKAEGYRDSLEKQNEARYLRDHREELVEELATTIVQKIIQRGKQCSEMQTEYEFVWSQTHNSDLPSPTSAASTHNTSLPSTVLQACHKSSLRSLSALSLTSDDSPDKVSEATEGPNMEIYSALRRESRASILGWKNVDRLDNSSASSVLQSPDGNWIALQTSQHSRPSLLTKRKSLVFSVLEKESGVVSAYDEMGSDTEEEAEHDSWGLALLQFRQRLSEETRSSDSQRDTEHYPPLTSPSSGHFTNTETLNSDSENSTAPPTHTNKLVQNVTQRNKVSPEPYLPYEHYGPSVRLSHSPRLGTLDVNFNPQVVGDSSEGEEQAEQIRRLRRRKRNKRESAEQSRVQNSLCTGENGTLLPNTFLMKGQDHQETQSPLPPPIYQSTDTVTPPNHVTSTAMTSEFVYQNAVASNPVLPGQLTDQSKNESLAHDSRSQLSKTLVPICKEELSSSDDEPIRKVIDRRGNGEREEESYRVRQREKTNETQKESPYKIDMEWNKMKMERLGERWIERQIKSKCEKSDVVRQRERDQKRKENAEVEKHQGWDRQEKTETKRHVERSWQVRQLDNECKTEKEAENIKSIEKEAPMDTRVSGFRMLRDLQDSKTQQMTIIPDGGVNRKKSVEEEHSEKGHCLTEESINRGLIQKRKSERGSIKRAEAHSQSDLSDPEEQTSPTEKYSAASLCSITTEVLKVLNATEELIGEAEGKGHDPLESPNVTPLSSGSDNKKLDHHLTKMEENVYLAAGTVYGLEEALSDLEECARSISSSTTENELAFLEDQVATAAAQVQQSELQISDIEARISALKNAGLNVSVCSRFPRLKPQTLDSSRQQRRKLPAPPARSLSRDHCSHDSNRNNLHPDL